MTQRRVDSFTSGLGLMSSHGGSITSSLHSLPGPWFDNLTAAAGPSASGKRPSYASSEVCFVCLCVCVVFMEKVPCCTLCKRKFLRVVWPGEGLFERRSL